MEQREVRILLASLLGGVLYLFGSLVILVQTVHTYCQVRPLLLGDALLGVVLLVFSMRLVLNTGLIFLMPAVFFLMGTGIPGWLFVHAMKVCAVQAGR